MDREDGGREDDGKEEREKVGRKSNAIVIANWMIPSTLLTYLIQQVVPPPRKLRREVPRSNRTLTHPQRIRLFSLSEH